MRVVLAGGGSAGHVSPLLALADRLSADDPSGSVVVLGTSEGLEARLVPDRGYRLHHVPKVPLPRRPSAAAARLPGDLSQAVAAARAAIMSVGAEVVVGFGGYVAAPAYLAARRSGVPIVVHEQNSRPGFANRLGARLTRWVAVTFPGTPLPHARWVGMPLRPEITSLDRAAARPGALAEFGLDPGRPTLLVVGGSLGAARFNDVVPRVARELAAAGVQVLHLTGLGKQVDVPAPRPGDPAYVVRPYVDRMEQAYAVADLVVGRAGASTVCELAALGLPAVYVPLPVGNGEQRLNASSVVAAGGGVVVEDVRFTPELVREQVLALATDPHRLREMGSAAATVGRRGADRDLAAMVATAAGSARVR